MQDKKKVQNKSINTILKHDFITSDLRIRNSNFRREYVLYVQ